MQNNIWKLYKIIDKNKTVRIYSYSFNQYGEPGGIRTPDPWLRRPMLYPTELLTHIVKCQKFFMTINIIAYILFIVNKKLFKICQKYTFYNNN